MRQITVDFDKMNICGLVDNKHAGYLGEHNATELVFVKPVGFNGNKISVAFMTNGEVIHSKYFSADEEIKVSLWQQLTQDNTLYVQLEAYDENGDYLGKSNVAKLNLGNSVHGVDVIADSDNSDVYSEIAQNSSFREILEDNVDTLDKLTTSVNGKLLFDGKEIEGVGGASENGATFIPSVDDKGNISWTNDKGLPNPETVNIKGEQGVSGVYVGSGDMPEGYNVQIDPSGEAVIIPTKTSQLTNDSGFVTDTELDESLSETKSELATKTELAEISQNIADETTARENAIADLKAQGIQQTPVFVDSIEECTDTSKVYVLPDGYIYAYMNAESQTLTADDFVGGEVQANGSITLPNASGWSSRIATKNLLPLSDKISVSCPSPYQYFVYYYTGETEDTFIGKTSWKSGDIDDVSTDVIASGTSSGAQYCRISLRDGTDTDADLQNRFDEFMTNVTITQGSATGKEWGNTGHAFVPADYEDRIIALEKALEGIEYGSY